MSSLSANLVVNGLVTVLGSTKMTFKDFKVTDNILERPLMYFDKVDHLEIEDVSISDNSFGSNLFVFNNIIELEMSGIQIKDSKSSTSSLNALEFAIINAE